MEHSNHNESADYLTCEIKLVKILSLKSWWENPEYLKLLRPENVLERKAFWCIDRVQVKNISRPDSDNTMLSRCGWIQMQMKIHQFGDYNLSDFLTGKVQAWVMRSMPNCGLVRIKDS